VRKPDGRVGGQNEAAGGATAASEGVPRFGDSTLALGKRGQLAMYQNLGLYDLPRVRLDGERAVMQADASAADNEQRIRDLTLEISMLDPPRITRFAERSLNPAGPRKALRLLIGFFAGAMIYLGIFFCVQWVRRRPVNA